MSVLSIFILISMLFIFIICIICIKNKVIKKLKELKELKINIHTKARALLHYLNHSVLFKVISSAIIAFCFLYCVFIFFAFIKAAALAAGELRQIGFSDIESQKACYRFLFDLYLREEGFPRNRFGVFCFVSKRILSNIVVPIYIIILAIYFGYINERPIK